MFKFTRHTEKWKDFKSFAYGIWWILVWDPGVMIRVSEWKEIREKKNLFKLFQILQFTEIESLLNWKE